MTLRSCAGRAPASSSMLPSWVRLLQCSSSASGLAGGGLNPGASHLSVGINVKSSLGFLLGGMGVYVYIYIFTYINIYDLYLVLQWACGRHHRLVLPWDLPSHWSSLPGWDDAQTLSLLPRKCRGPWHLSRCHAFGVYLVCASHVLSPSSGWSQSEARRGFCSISQLAYAAPEAR